MLRNDLVCLHSFKPSIGHSTQRQRYAARNEFVKTKESIDQSLMQVIDEKIDDILQPYLEENARLRQGKGDIMRAKSCKTGLTPAVRGTLKAKLVSMIISASNRHMQLHASHIIQALKPTSQEGLGGLRHSPIPSVEDAMDVKLGKG